LHSSTDGVEEVKILNCSLVGGEMFVVVYTQILIMREVRNNTVNQSSYKYIRYFFVSRSYYFEGAAYIEGRLIFRKVKYAHLA
jgi:hypothetical protein